MTILRVNPEVHKKSDLVTIGVDLVMEFIEDNPKLSIPIIKTGVNCGGYKGEYFPPKKEKPATIVISKSCVPAVKNPGFSWSFPGYKADMTPVGVAAHECGHHVQHCFRPDMRSLVYSTQFESCLSSYEPTASEMLAEAVKLFITNPDLLKTGRPCRYKFLTEDIGLTPIITQTWKDVLTYAHPKIIAAAEKWIIARAKR